jgi:plasmid stabilization system protein ParE
LRIELHPSADGEFAAQVAYYEDRETGLGRRFYNEVIAHLDWIAANPEVPRLRKGYRRVNLKVFPLYVAYTAERDRVWVLAVAHGSKRPGYWTKRMWSG